MNQNACLSRSYAIFGGTEEQTNEKWMRKMCEIQMKVKMIFVSLLEMDGSSEMFELCQLTRGSIYASIERYKLYRFWNNAIEYKKKAQHFEAFRLLFSVTRECFYY